MSEPFIGEIRMFGGTFAPRGWALCQGQLLSIAQNSALFSILGTIYGGNGQTTFGLPDLRGRSPVGMGQGPGLSFINQGQMSGAESTTLTMLEMPIHNHMATGTASLSIGSVSSNPNATPSATNNVLAASGAGQGSATIWSDSLNTPIALANPDTVTVTVQNAGGSQPVGLRNPYMGTNFIIALEGIFPSRN